MQKKITSLIVVLSVALAIQAESSSLWSFGLRGGGNTYIVTGEANAGIGYGGIFDLGYTSYWNTPNAEIGIHTGISAGYEISNFYCSVNRQFTNIDYLGNPIQYTLTATKITNTVHQVQVEVPLMLALRTENTFINIGAKFMMPLYDKYAQNLENLNIDAYYSEPDVHIVNRLITGKADESQVYYSGNGILPKYNVLLGIEIGYEWELNKRDRIGLGFYGDISPWSSYKPSTVNHVIEVAPIDNPDYPPAKVTIQPLCISSVKNLLYCDFGLKFYYGINHLNRHSAGLSR